MQKNEPVFRIHESDGTKEFYGIYDDLKADYRSGMKIMDIRAKYGLSRTTWRRYKKELMSDGIKRSL